MLNQSVKIVKRKRPATTDYSDSIVVSANKPQSRRAQFSVSDELAKDNFHYVGYCVQALRSTFPDSQRLWTVDKCYPYAEGGMLFVDQPQMPDEIDLCQIKALAMKKAGLRYIAITPQMSLQDAFMELDRCLL